MAAGGYTGAFPWISFIDEPIHGDEWAIRGIDRPYYAFSPRRVLDVLDVLDESRSRIVPTSYGRSLRRS